MANSDTAELTDKGRQTTFGLDRRLRQLHIDQLGFLPGSIDDPNLHRPISVGMPLGRIWKARPEHQLLVRRDSNA